MCDVRRSPEEPGRQDIEEEVCDLGSDPSEEVLLGGHLALTMRAAGNRPLKLYRQQSV